MPKPPPVIDAWFRCQRWLTSGLASGLTPEMASMTLQDSADSRAALAADEVLARTAARYRRGDRFVRHYAPSKLRRDPVHRDLLDLARREHFGVVADVGCGCGQLGAALLEAGLAARVIGLDWAARALERAGDATADLAFEARRQNLAEDVRLPLVDTVLFIDVLYQLPTAAQDGLLASAARAARRRIIIRALDPARGWRSRLTLTLERAGRWVWPHAGGLVNPRPLEVLAEPLRRAGFEVQIAACWRGTPFSNTLIIARRRENQES